MLRLVQLIHASGERRVAVVEEPRLRPLTTFRNVHELAMAAISRGRSISEVVHDDSSGAPLEYDAIYGGQSEWKLLPSIDQLNEPARCLVTGTGLTHKASAENRDSMHVSGTVSSAHQSQ